MEALACYYFESVRAVNLLCLEHREQILMAPYLTYVCLSRFYAEIEF